MRCTELTALVLSLTVPGCGSSQEAAPSEAGIHAIPGPDSAADQDGKVR